MQVRLKKYMEMRGADGGPLNMLCALPAFWVIHYSLHTHIAKLELVLIN